MLAFSSPAGRCVLLALGVLSGGCVPLWAAEPDGTALRTFQREVQPTLKQACFGCHGAKRQEADLRLDRLDPDLIDGDDLETWHDVLNKLNLGEMPPDDAQPLTGRQRQTLVGWLSEQLQRAEQAKRSTGGQVVLRRLTRYEYDHTLRDLLGVNLDFARDLPPEPVSADGFRNNGAVLGISPLQIELYLESARRGLEQAIVVGDKPRVFTHYAEKSEKIRRVKGDVSSRLVAGGRFLARMDDFPRRGEVLVRVRAGAHAPADAPWPRMRVTLGVRADVQAPEKTLGEVDVTAPIEDPQTYEFRGRIEDFPLPGHNPKFPGLQITVYNRSAVPPQPKAQGKKAKNKAKVEPAKVDQPNQQESVIQVESVAFEGPLITSWPPPSHTRILFPSEQAGDDSRYARQVLERFLRRAYRRPVTEADVDPLVRHFERLRPDYPSFELAIREVLALALISPEFLYLVEPKQQPESREPLNDFELASRLSYFLWSSMPDERLFELAAAGTLHKSDVLASEVDRMLADPKSRQFVRHFTDQWFDLAALDRVAVNPEYHPDFDDSLKASMRAETQRFFATLLDEDLSCLKLLDADFTFVNGPLAKHYGLEGPRGSALERIELSPADRRGGILTQGSFLLANSNGEDSHPIKRAVWLLDRLLGDPPAPPPPDVPELDPDQPGLAGLPLKGQLELHRRREACNHCHRGIDPWGIALENYDAVGRWRTEYAATSRGKIRRPPVAVDASVCLPDDTVLDGVEALKQYLLKHRREQFAETLVRRLLAYSVGRTLDLSDRRTVESLTGRFAEDDYRLRRLIVAIVQSDAFQSK